MISRLWMLVVFMAGSCLMSVMVWLSSGTTVGFVVIALMILVEIIRIMQTVTLWLFARKAADPIPMTPEAGLRVAVHTTIVPGKEPFDIVARTLLAMKAMTYTQTVDVWLLDEGDDPTLKAWCEVNGVHHFSRKGIEEWNMPSGQFKARTKHGNLNSFHAAHGHEYDIVAQMDPDHIPSPEFLERTLGYFRDPDVGFVVAPQVYGNGDDNWIAKASAFQAYVFHGVIQRGGNGMAAPLLIGTNHLVRVSALHDVGGYADNIIEDHLTSMAMYAKTNNRGNYWKGVYTPDVVSIGEGPTSFADYYSQQKRWAYGIWQIAQKHSPRMFGGMRPAQRIAFAGLQFFYPSVAVSWVLSFVLSILMLSGAPSTRSPGLVAIVWMVSFGSSISYFWWLRRFNLVEHEKHDWGLAGMALLLMCIPVYVAAGVQAILRRKLTYAVTAKGNLASSDTLRTFTPHLAWVTMIVGAVVAAVVLSDPVGTATLAWMGWMTLVCLAPVFIYAVTNLKQRSVVEFVPEVTETNPREMVNS